MKQFSFPDLGMPVAETSRQAGLEQLLHQLRVRLRLPDRLPKFWLGFLNFVYFQDVSPFPPPHELERWLVSVVKNFFRNTQFPSQAAVHCLFIAAPQVGADLSVSRAEENYRKSLVCSLFFSISLIPTASCLQVLFILKSISYWFNKSLLDFWSVVFN